VVTGAAINTAERPVKAVVIAGFHDADGAPMKRPFTELTIDGGGRYPVRFVGPDGSESGYLFVGDLAY
jgi:hypothetical protein